MYAEFLIRHSPLSSDALKSILVAKFKAEDRAALKNSPLFNSGKWDRVVLYSTETPSYRLLCVPTQDEESQLYVEPITGNVIQICQSVWRGTKNALVASAPELSSLKLVDDASGKDIMSASTSTFYQELGRREALSPLMVGAASIIYALIGVFTFARKDAGQFLAGAVTGLVGALAVLWFAFQGAKKGKLSWR